MTGLFHERWKLYCEGLKSGRKVEKRSVGAGISDIMAILPQPTCISPMSRAVKDFGSCA